MSHVFLIGGNHWDETWTVEGPLRPGESSPIRTVQQPGGAVANMARTLKKVGHDCTLASVHGSQMPPIQGAYVQQIADVMSARYVSLETAQGRVLYGFADMAIYDQHMTSDWYTALAPVAHRADAVVLDCNGAEDALEALTPATFPFEFTVGLAVSPAKVRRLLPVLDHLSLLFCNTAEAHMLGPDLAHVVKAVVTSGADGAALYERGQKIQGFPAPKWTPASANGLGDRLAGLTLAKILNGLPLDQALPQALKALPC